jgi:hypothetical protein
MSADPRVGGGWAPRQGPRRDGGLAAPDQLGDDGRIGLDRGWRVASRRPAGTLVRERPDEVAAFENSLQRVPDQRIGFPQHLLRPASRRGVDGKALRGCSETNP